MTRDDGHMMHNLLFSTRWASHYCDNVGIQSGWPAIAYPQY